MTWEAYAIRYGRHDRPAQANYLLPVADPHEAMPLDYFVWLLRGPGRTRDRRRYRLRRRAARSGAAARSAARSPTACAPWTAIRRRCGTWSSPTCTTTTPASIGIFPNARLHIQDREMAFATGRHMCTACIRVPFEADHVVAMVRAVYADARAVPRRRGRGGARRHAPPRRRPFGRACRWCGWRRRAGRWCIASDAMHFYANGRTGNPFPIIFDLGAMTQGWRIAKRLAGGDETRVIPGHDPGGARALPRRAGPGWRGGRAAPAAEGRLISASCFPG